MAMLDYIVRLLKGNADFLWRFASNSQLLNQGALITLSTDVVVTSDRVFLWQRPLYKARFFGLVARQLGTA